MILDDKDPKRVFEQASMLRRLARMGVIESENQKLELLLNLTVERFLERRLQTRILAAGYAKSIHHARMLITQRHIRVGKCLVNQPNFIVRVESEKHIGFAPTSVYGGKTKKSGDEDY
jgi:small subunit ribosomal protein S9e